MSSNASDSSAGGSDTEVAVVVTGGRSSRGAECLRDASSAARCRRFPSRFDGVAVSDVFVSANKQQQQN